MGFANERVWAMAEFAKHASGIACVAAGIVGCHRATPAGPQCGAEIPAQRLWVESTDAQYRAELRNALACARERHTRVLLEFVAPWCADCQEMTQLEQTPTVAEVLRRRYERVRVNVGRWDQHADLRAQYGIDRIASYVVIDPATGHRIAQTTVEPITGARGRMTPEQWAAWLNAPSNP